MITIFNQTIVNSKENRTTDTCSNYLNTLDIDLKELLNNEELFKVILKKKNKRVKIVIKLNPDKLYDLVSRYEKIPLSIHSFLAMGLPNEGQEVQSMSEEQLHCWLNCIENSCINNSFTLSYYDNNFIKIGNCFYDQKNKSFSIEEPPKRIKNCIGGCVVDCLDIKSKRQLYTLLNRTSYQTNGVVLRNRVHNGKRLITLNKTLIIAPPKYIKNILNEIKHKKLFVINDKNYSNISFEKLQQYDCAVCSYTFLDRIMQEKENRSNNVIFGQPPFNSANSPIDLFSIYWERKIMYNYDYLSEYKKGSDMRKMISSLESLITWIFVNRKVDGMLMDMVVKQLFGENFNCTDYNVINKLFKQKLYNTVPDQNLIVKKIEYSPKEQFILRTPLLSNKKGLKSMLEHTYPLLFGDVSVKMRRFKKIEEIKKFVFKKLKQHGESINNQIANSNSGSEVDISTLMNRIEKINSKVKFFDNLFKQIDTDGFDNCPICINPIDPKSVMVTKCGHLFCYYCVIQSIFLSSHDELNCPQCRTELSLKQCYVINDDNTTLAKYGSKISELITYLRNSDKVVLVLSKWGSLLKHLKHIFSDEKIVHTKYHLVTYRNMISINRNYQTCILLDQPLKDQDTKKLNFHCKEIIEYRFDD